MKRRITCVSDEDIAVEILESKFLMIMEIVIKHCLDRFTGTPCMPDVAHVFTL